ncbi:secondary thiamine-phosphate synthase enzyme YjbQ [Caldanaerobius polysaccharolyticus]|uniref:secondary thiamine-phosphate synthase enzyme YjbQ n=1 Tax=Caldanaerobius polysaccharolyticus TaxID=44256 RepID=UPI00047C0033|nr:secondary thiamine-phosphate synthase enzyme YjbQ [Caldanaerobius polysaccharolyticus]
MIELELATRQREEMINITGMVREELKKHGVQDGICYVFVPHTTAGVTINENADSDVKRDILSGFKAMVPDIPYRHVEGNSDAHIKASLVGACVSVFVEKGELVLGTWQGIYFCEFDGPRRRKVYLKFIKAS